MVVRTGRERDGSVMDGTVRDDVVKAEVSFRERTATVTFDDSRAKVEDPTAATAQFGYPSRPKEPGA